MLISTGLRQAIAKILERDEYIVSLQAAFQQFAHQGLQPRTRRWRAQGRFEAAQ